jgi:chitodextrinase
MEFLRRHIVSRFKIAGFFIIIAVVGLFGLLFLNTAHAAAPAFVQDNQNLVSSGTSMTTSFKTATTAGDLIVAFVEWDNSGSMSLTDSNGNTYTAATPVVAYPGTNNGVAEILYAKNIKGGTDTLTASFGTAISSWGIMYIHEYSGISTTNPVDVISTATGSSSAMSSGSATTTNANDLIFGAGGSFQAVTASGSGFTTRMTEGDDRSEDKFVTTTGSYAATATQSGTGWLQLMVAFRGASSDTTPPSAPTSLAATQATQTQANLTWTASTDNVGVTGYNVYRSTTSGFTPGTGNKIGTSTTNSYSDTGVNIGTYYYIVTAYDAAGNVSSNSNQATLVDKDVTAPSVPTSPKATAASVSQINVSWTASTDNVGVTGYNILRNGTKVGTSTSTSYSDTGLTPNTSYTYTVSAYDAAGNTSAVSTSASATTLKDTTPPSAPTGLAATQASQTQASLTWTASTDNVGVTGYNVYRSTTSGFTPGTGNKIGTSTTASYSDTGLSIGTYYYIVTAYDAAGNVSGNSNQATLVDKDITPPSVPTNLSATAASTSQINLSWTASTDNVGVTGYKVYRNGTQVGTATALTYNDTGLASGTLYRYTVSAYDAAGNTSAQSTAATATTQSTDTIPPTAPTNLAASLASQTQVNLSWTASTDNVGVTGYKIYRSTTSGFTPSSGNQIGTTTTATTFQDTTVGVNTYYYLVTASDAAGNTSTPSNQASISITDTTPPSAPTSLKATQASQTQVNLNWTASTDNVGVTGYNVYRSTTSGFTPSPTTLIGSTTSATTFNDTTVGIGSYYYLVTAFDAAGNVSSPSNQATVAVTDITPPTPPTNLAAAVASQTQVNLSWTASTDNVGVVGYDVYRNGNLIGATSGTTYVDTGLAPNIAYNYTVSAYDGAGNVSSLSNQASITIADTTPPSVPTNLTATSFSSSQINLAWTASTDNVGVTGYKVYQNGVQIATTASTSYQNTGLSANTAYTYTVAAYDAAGNVSAQSTSASATTANIDTIPPTAPTNLAATVASQTQVSLSWTASTDNVGVVGYTIYRSTTSGFTPSTANQIGTTTTATTFSDTSVNIGTYYYLVTASDAAGNVSPVSNQATIVVPDVTPPSVPTGLTDTVVSSTEIDLSWTASTDNVGVAGYNVYSNGTLVGTTAGTTTSYKNTSLTPATTYAYTISASDAAGNMSAQTAAVSATTQNAPDTTPPSVPTNLTATASGSAQVNLSWTASTDNVGVTGYNVYRNGAQVGTTTGITYQDVGLSPSTTYSYTVAAFDAAGNVSAQSQAQNATTSAAPPFIAGASSNHHYLVDQNGNPFLLVGDSGWNISIAISSAAADSYLSTRASQGFNSELIEAIGGPYDNQSANWATFDGIVPFYQSDGVTLGTGPSNYDVTKPNPAYWARLDNVVQQAEQDGITVWILPLADAAYEDNPSFYSTQGLTKLTTYATWLANRYKNYPNVDWDFADDYGPALQPANDPYLVAMANAIRAVMPNSLATIEENDGILSPSQSPNLDLSTDDTNWSATTHNATQAQVNLNWMYDSRTNSPDMLRGYNLANPIPVFFGEGVYENGTKANGITGTPQTLRAYDYNTSLTGGTGLNYGENTVWWNGPGWQSLMSTPGVTQIGYWKTLMTSLKWWTLVPDQTNSFATSGATTAASSADGSLGMAYLQTGGSVTINMARLNGTITSKWFDPTTGASTTIGTYSNTGSQQFTAPAAHSDGTDDWVLLLQGTPGVVDTTPPSVPTNLTATTISSSQVNLSWTASTDNVGVAGYNVYRNGSLVGTTTGTTYQDTGLTASTSYSYTVAAYDAAGNVSAQSASASATTAASTQLTGTWQNISPPVSLSQSSFNGNNYGTQTIGLSPSNPNIVYVGTCYQGIWKTTNAGSSWTEVNTGTNGPNLNTGRNWTLAVDPTNANIVYTVAGYGYGQGIWKSTDGGVDWTQMMPTSLFTTATADVYSISIDPTNPLHLLVAFHSGWDGGSDAGVMESMDGGNTWTLHQPVAGWGAGEYVMFINSTTWLVGTQGDGFWRTTNSGQSWTQVSSVNMQHGADQLYQTSNGTLYVGAVSTLLRSTTSGASWTSVGPTDADGYNAVIGDGTTLYAQTANTGTSSTGNHPYYVSPQTDGTNWTAFNSQTFADGPMSMAYDATNHIVYSSNWDAGVWKLTLLPPDTTPPSAPTNLTATAASQTQVNLSWTASTDNVGVVGYNVYRNGALVGTTTTNSYQDTGLTASTSYSYTVAAYDAAGNISALSNQATVTIADTTPPTVPTNLTALATLPTQVNLSWTASTDNVGVVGYYVYRNGTQLATVTTGSSFNDATVVPSTTYSYTVAAYDAAGNVSAQTASVNVTTPATVDTTPPSTPTNLSVTVASSSQINLSWTASTDNVGVVGYYVYRNGGMVGTTSGTSYQDTGLSPSTAYSYTVAAYDAAGNVSAQSQAQNGTTLATASCQFMTVTNDTPAFCDDFSEGASAGGRAGQLNPAKWSVSRVVGGTGTNDWMPFPSTPASACQSGVTSVNSDNDVMVCDSASGHQGQILTAQSDQYYGLLSMRPRQPFNFAGRTGTITA